MWRGCDPRTIWKLQLHRCAFMSFLSFAPSAGIAGQPPSLGVQCLVDVLQDDQTHPSRTNSSQLIPQSSRAGIAILESAEAAYTPRDYPGVSVYTDAAAKECKKNGCSAAILVESAGISYVSEPIFIHYNTSASSQKFMPTNYLREMLPLIYADDLPRYSFSIQSEQHSLSVIYQNKRTAWPRTMDYGSSSEAVVPYFHIHAETLPIPPDTYCETK